MKRHFICVCAVFVTVLMLFFPQKSVYYSKQALDICSDVIIPSLFPFFVCSGLLVYSGFAEVAARMFRPVMKPVFNVNENGAAAFVLGIISGYPLGAVTACRLYESAYLSKSEAERLLAFCNNSGPLFILGAVGTAIYANPKIGVVLYLSHIISAILVGVLFRFYKKEKFAAPKSRLNVREIAPAEMFSVVLSDSVNSILTVCGAIIFFFTVSSVIIGLFPQNELINALLSSVSEFTGGIKKISVLDAPLYLRLALSSFAVGFAGLCVHMQVLSVTSGYSLSLMPYILGKLLHGIFSAVITYLFISLFPNTVEVFSYGTARLSGGFCWSSVYVLITVISLLVFSAIVLACGKIPEKTK